MPPDGVIVVMYPVSSLPFEIGERGPGPGVDQLFLIRREERFRYGIIVADSRPAERPPDIIPRAVLVERRGSVLGEFNRSMQHRVVEVSVAARRRLRRESSSRGSCGAGC